MPQPRTSGRVGPPPRPRPALRRARALKSSVVPARPTPQHCEWFQLPLLNHERAAALGHQLAQADTDERQPRAFRATYRRVMWFVVLTVCVLVVGFVIWRRITSVGRNQSTPTRPTSTPRPANAGPVAKSGVERVLGDVEAMPDLRKQAEAEAERMMSDVEAEAALRHAELVRETDRELERVRVQQQFPKPGAEPLVLGANGGPTWMSPDEWVEKVSSYRGQGRTNDAIREVAEYLERHGPTWPLTAAERSDRAEVLGIVIREEYLSPENEAVALEPGPSGLPDAWVERVRDRLLVVTPIGWINPRSRTAATRAGLWSFAVRGTSHHKGAARGDFTPGSLVRLVREPDNSHDPNAIAVYASEAHNLAGYVPRGYAKRLSKILDAEVDIVAVSVSGSGPGNDDVPPHVLAVERALWNHLNRDR